MYDWVKNLDYSYLFTFIAGFVIPFFTFLPKVLESLKLEKEIKKIEAEKIKLEEEAGKLSEEKNKLISEQGKLDNEKLKFHAEQKKLEEESLKLEKEKDKFNAERVKLEEEAQKLNEEKNKFQAETIKLQEEAAKIKKEAEKLTIEIRQKKMDIQKDAQLVHKTYEDKVILGQKLTREYIEFISAKDLINVEKKREELCDCLLNEVFPTFNSYFVLQKIVFEDDEKQRKSFIENEIIKFFKTCKMAVDMVNRENILTRIKKTKLTLSKEILDSYVQYAFENLNYDSEPVKELKTILNELGINYL